MLSAADSRAGRQVAVKIMISLPAGAFTRLRRVVSGLDHPNIVGVIDAGQTADGLSYIVMELLEGEDLERRIEREHRLHLAATAQLLTQAASALDAAHCREIVHGNLKPSNLFLGRTAGGMHVRVLDFGFPAAPGAATPYMAPEQARLGEVTVRTDIYAIGGILYQALAGRPPLSGSGVEADPTPLRTLVPELPPGVEGVVHKALARRTLDRFATVGELADAFVSSAHPPHRIATAVAAGPGSRQVALDDAPTPPLELQDQLDELKTPPLERVAREKPGRLTDEMRLPKVLAPEVDDAQTQPAIDLRSVGRPSEVSADRGLSRVVTAAEPADATLEVMIAPAGRAGRVALLCVTFVLVAGGIGAGVWLAWPTGQPRPGSSPSPDGAPQVDLAPAADGAQPDLGLDVAIRDRGPQPDRQLPDLRVVRRRRPGRRRHVTEPPVSQQPSAVPGVLQVGTRAEGGMVSAEIYLDGEKIGESPLYHRGVAPGLHRLEARRQGYRSVSRQVRVLSGEEQSVVLELQR